MDCKEDKSGYFPLSDDIENLKIEFPKLNHLEEMISLKIELKDMKLN